MLTTEQKKYFDVFGFLVLRQVFPQSEMDAIRQVFDEVLSEKRQGRPFTGDQTQTVLWFVEQRAELARLAEDDRIYPAIEDLLGPGFIWVLSDGNYYVGDTQWHGGTGEEQVLKHIKVAIYPDPVAAENGCLRVIPGSHHTQFQQHLKPLLKQFKDPQLRPFGIEGSQVPSVALESQPGDVVFFSENMWHGSFNGEAGRRMFTLIYYANPATDAQKAYVRQQQKKCVAMFNPHESFIHSDRPRIRQMVAPLVELAKR